MEKEKFNEIEKTVKALHKELKPIFEEIKILGKEIESIGNDDSNVLIKIISRITKTARRHDIENKVMIGGTLKTVGTNHQGLGFEQAYSSQLTPLTCNYMSYEQIARNILFTEEAVIDLTAIIKKSNQKIFMNTIKILKKYGLTKSFSEFKGEELNIIDVKIDNDYKIKIEIGRYNIYFNLVKNGDETISRLSSADYESTNNNLTNDRLLKEISVFKYGELSLSTIKMGVLMSQHRLSIIKAIKSKRELLNGIKDDYIAEHKQLNELLEPILALEKL